MTGVMNSSLILKKNLMKFSSSLLRFTSSLKPKARMSNVNVHENTTETIIIILESASTASKESFTASPFAELEIILSLIPFL